ncbi:NAD(P)H-dependent oxidoreductase [Pistricoccus aurantiacus]|uniref:NAD(P)H-dependent oxidoreductase n=1 Tax=Pistricoccus aurantiacus TaxID=1883414 RepID=A0A5B8SXK2_9GAMM|nr:NAD(P)H-dependent oxidoreductase [Pistricoccus aurantiacus]QEA40804.1 NAD(P)H-dependent oxidoreductase [Pistricoccus aurantiacus]
MHVLILYCHPEPHSFNAALKDVAIEVLENEGHTVEVADLYAENFDPVERPGHFTTRADAEVFSALTEQRHHFESNTLPGKIQHEIDRLWRADLVILQFPLWWHAQPAMLKGWFDRVFVYGGLYSGSRRFDRGPLRGRRALCSVTTGAPAATFSRFGRSADITTLMWPIHCSLYYVGFEVLAPQLTYGVQGGGLSYQAEASFRCQLEADKTRWARRLTQLETEAPLPFSGWADWDEDGVLRETHPLRWRP